MPNVSPQQLLQRAIAAALRLSVVRAVLHYASHRGAMLADSVTYRALFSVFAGVLLLFSAAALWLAGNPEAMQALVGALDSLLPGLSSAVDIDAARAPVGFTIVGVISLAGLLGAALSAIGSLRQALHELAGVITDDTSFVRVQLRNVAVGACFGGLLLAAAVASIITASGTSVVADWLGISESSTLLRWGTRIAGLLVVLVIDAVALALAFRLLSGIQPAARALYPAALVGAIGLLVLQEFSGLFVRGATSNPLLASFAALIAILLWINLSAQVILIAASLMVVLEAREHNRVGETYGAQTLTQLRRRNAEQAVANAARELRAAQEAEQREHERERERNRA